MPASVSRRPELSSDSSFLRQLIVSHAAAQLGADSWPEPMRSHLLATQYSARLASIRENFPGAVSEIIVADGQNAGWLVLAFGDDEVRVIEMLVQVEFRNKGIGTRILREVFASADHQHRPVRLHVRTDNLAAIRLYERVGFQSLEAGDLQQLMERQPSK